MKINNISINFPNIVSERVENELIIYNSDSEIILELNQTAALIYDLILQYRDRCLDITTEIIYNAMINIFTDEVPEKADLIRDIDEALEILLSNIFVKTS